MAPLKPALEEVSPLRGDEATHPNLNHRVYILASQEKRERNGKSSQPREVEALERLSVLSIAASRPGRRGVMALKRTRKCGRGALKSNVYGMGAVIKRLDCFGIPTPSRWVNKMTPIFRLLFLHNNYWKSLERDMDHDGDDDAISITFRVCLDM